MENLLARHRNVTILVAVLFAEVIGLAVQVKRTADTDSTRLIRVWTVSAISPLEKGFIAAQQSVASVWHNYFYLRGVRAQNRQLQEEIEQLRLQQVRLSEDAGQARRLQRLLGFKEQFIAKTLPAQVIGSSGSDMSRVVYIDKGEGDGVKPDMAVITADGVVGKVLRVFPTTAQVLLINDPSSGVGAILEKSRLQGVIKGTANGELVLDKMMSDEQVEPGDQLLTSGGDQIFPKGLPVGTVKSVSPGKDVFLTVRIRPAAQLNRLEEVLVITSVVERQPTAGEAQGALRAADILAARLPSVPEKSALPATGIPLPPGMKPPSAPAPKPAAAVKTGAAPVGAQPGTVAKSPAAAQAKTANGTAHAVSARPKVNGTPSAAAGNGPPGTAVKKPRAVKPSGEANPPTADDTTVKQPPAEQPEISPAPQLNTGGARHKPPLENQAPKPAPAAPETPQP